MNVVTLLIIVQDGRTVFAETEEGAMRVFGSAAFSEEEGHDGHDDDRFDGLHDDDALEEAREEGDDPLHRLATPEAQAVEHDEERADDARSERRHPRHEIWYSFFQA